MSPLGINRLSRQWTPPKVLAVPLKTLWVLGPSQSAIWRLWLECADAQAYLTLRRAHMRSCRNLVPLIIFQWTYIIQYGNLLSHLMTKPTKWHVRPAKTLISLVFAVHSMDSWGPNVFKRTAKTLIRLGGCPGLCVYAVRTGHRWFCHVNHKCKIRQNNLNYIRSILCLVILVKPNSNVSETVLLLCYIYCHKTEKVTGYKTRCEIYIKRIRTSHVTHGLFLIKFLPNAFRQTALQFVVMKRCWRCCLVIISCDTFSVKCHKIVED